MRRIRRLLAGLASVLLSLSLIVSLALFAVTWNGAGRAFLHDQTERIAARLMGSGALAELGRQTVGIGTDGSLEITWQDIRLGHEGSPIPSTEVERLTVGLNPLELIEGHPAIRTVAMSGATIDLTRRVPAADATPPPIEVARLAAEPDPRPLVRRTMDRVFAIVDREFAELGRSGIRRVDIARITLVAPVAAGGGPFVSRIENAELQAGENGSARFSATVGVDDVTLVASGDATFDHARNRLADLRLSIGPLDLGSIVPPGSPDDRRDTRPFATDAKVSAHADLSTDAASGARTLSLTLGVGAGAVQAGRGHTKVETAALSAVYREGASEIALPPSLLVFDDVSLKLDGAVRPAATGSGDLAFRLTARDIRSALGQAADDTEPRLASAEIEGSLALSPLRVTLAKAGVETGSGRIDGSGVIDLGAPDAMTRLRIASDAMSVEDIKALWPFNLASNARRWVLQHLSGEGTARDAVFTLDLTRARLGRVFKPDNHPDPAEMRLSLGFDGIALSTVGELPRLLDATGRVETLGGDTVVSLDTAKVENHSTILVAPSSATFRRQPKEALQDVDLEIDLGAAGRIDELLDVAARPPVGALRSLDIKPADASGAGAGEAKLLFHLGDDVPKGRELQSYAVDLQLDDVTLQKPFSGRSLAKLGGPISIVPGAVEGDLRGEIDGVPATIRFGQPFGPTPAVERRLAVELSLDGERLAKLAPALKDVVAGEIAARITAKTGEADSYRASVDLRQASLALPVIGWRKGKGVPADLAFDIRPSDGAVELSDLSLKGEGFAASGTVVADAKGLRSADLRDVSFNPGDEVDLAVGRASNGYGIELTGERFDARPLLADLRSSLGERAARRGSKNAGQLDVAVALARVTGFGGEEIRDLSLNYAGSANGIAALSMVGTDGGGGRFSADLSPRGEDRSIAVRASDAGRLADFGGLYARMQGGALALDLLGSSDEGYAGTLVAERFTLVDEPRLSSLVASSPAQGAASLAQAVGAPLRTERADFDHASAAIAYGKDGLRVRDGIIRGPVFGSSFSGTIYDARNRIDIAGSFMPAYGLNGMFGKIPIVGRILGNGREGGLIGITYRLEGAFASPTLTVNPISAIAPGIFRSIFAYEP